MYERCQRRETVNIFCQKITHTHLGRKEMSFLFRPLRVIPFGDNLMDHQCNQQWRNSVHPTKIQVSNLVLMICHRHKQWMKTFCLCCCKWIIVISIHPPHHMVVPTNRCKSIVKIIRRRSITKNKNSFTNVSSTRMFHTCRQRPKLKCY